VNDLVGVDFVQLYGIAPALRSQKCELDLLSFYHRKHAFAMNGGAGLFIHRYKKFAKKCVQNVIVDASYDGKNRIMLAKLSHWLH
jgi:hypothetical protein